MNKQLITLALFGADLSATNAAIINVVETRGDNDPTDTIQAVWSGVTYNRRRKPRTQVSSAT
tara:strand:+ start:264 stop:449 length:186 start_codon:yes stop_codon:yes gene_type:complete